MQQITLKHRVINSVLLILMLVTLSPTKISLANSQSSATLPVVDKKYVAGELLIRLQPGIILQSSADGVTVSAAGVNDLFQKYNVTAAEPLFPNSEATSQGLERTYKVSLAADADMLSFLADLSADASVEYAEPNYLYHILGFRDDSVDPVEPLEPLDHLSAAAAIAPSSFVTNGLHIPSDPLFSVEWGLHNVLNDGTRIGADIQAPAAWNQFTGTQTNTITNSVLIAIIDSGLDYNHEDLNDGRVRTDIDHDYINKDDDAMDDDGHGTHVAGTIAAETDNGVGIAGIVWQAEILPLKVCDNTGSCGLDYIVNAIKYAADHGARVINMSLGSDSCSETLEDAIDYAYFEKGVVIVAAAGNNNGSVGYPAKYEPVLAVGAIDRHSQRAYFSDNGDALDLTAPGVRIFSTLPNDNYEAYSGTSMASPHVAGVAALLIAQRPELTNNQVRDMMMASATDLGAVGKDYYFGEGVVNAAAALQASAPISPTIPDISRCVAEECSGEATVIGEVDALQLLQTLRAVRDQLFAQQAFSQRWSEVYYESQSEVFWRVLANPELRAAALKAMRSLHPAMESLVNADSSSIKVTREMVTNADTVISMLIEQGSPALRDELRSQWTKLAPARFVGMDIKDAWQQVKEESAFTKTYLPLIGK